MWGLVGGQSGPFPSPHPGRGMWCSGALLLLHLLSPGTTESSDYLYSEVIIPTKIEQKGGFPSKKEVTYLVKAEGVGRILHLQQKSFIFRNMPVYTFNQRGNRVEERPFIKVGCYYSGYVEGSPGSKVLLSTCFGLWGHVNIGSLKYEIRPIEKSTTFQHLIYRKTPEQHEPCRSIPENQWAPPSQKDQRELGNERRIITEYIESEFPGHNAPSRYLEYFAVCDHAMYQRENRNTTRVIQVVLQILSFIHSIYEEIGLHIVLTGMEIWTKQDFLEVRENTLEAFYNYAISELRSRVHFDHASLFTSTGEDDSFGKTWREHSCLSKQISVSAVKSSASLRSDAIAAAHQLGHAVFGFVHDDFLEEKGLACSCSCTEEPGHCIMHSTVVNCHMLSNCSKNAYEEFLSNQRQTCLLNLPKDPFQIIPEPALRKAICGNGIVEDDEECDCGVTEESSLLETEDTSSVLFDSSIQVSKGLKDCQENGCCLKECKRNIDVDCFYGPCCDSCKFVEEGVLCREAASECDLPEYCTGSSANCPQNVYKQDGTPCATSDICYMGKCLNLHQHCTAIFGQGAQPAPVNCFKEVNTRGDRTGNCGRDKTGYKKCGEKDVFCGRIQCINVNKIPVIETGQAVLQTPIEDGICWGTEFHAENNAHDIGAIEDGSTCGLDKICINRVCVDMKVLNYDCDFAKCNHQGICNSNKNCHCTYGWAPPNCSGKGYGGSIDSGPPPEQIKSKKLLMLGPMIGIGLVLLALGIMFKKYMHIWFGRVIREKISPKAIDPSSESTDQISDDEGESESSSLPQ